MFFKRNLGPAFAGAAGFTARPNNYAIFFSAERVVAWYALCSSSGAVIQEGELLKNIELPRCVQIEPVGRGCMAPRHSPVSIRVDGMRNGAPAFLSFDAFCRLIGQFPDLEELRLHGAGEPLAHPRFFDMVRYAAERGIQVATTSRLQVFSRRRAQECVSSGLRRLEVPLDAAGTREYDFSRRGARHERMLRHLRFLTEARKAGRSPWPQVSFTAVVMRRNLSHLAGVVRAAHEHGVQGVSVLKLEQFADASGILPGHRRMVKFIESESLEGVAAELIEQHFAEARAVAQELHVGLELPKREASAASRCPWPWHGVYIGFSGEAKPCGMAARKNDIAFGNMLKEGVAPVWRGEAYGTFRERHLSDDPPGLCRGCPRRTLVQEQFAPNEAQAPAFR